MVLFLPLALILLTLDHAAPSHGTNNPAAAPPQQRSPQSESTEQAGGDAAKPRQDQPPPQPPSSGSSIADLFSIERIRRDLERRPSIAFAIPDPTLPRYRVQVFGYQFRPPDWRTNFQLPPMTVPQPLGGADYYEMQRLITPPQAWGSTPFSNSDLVKMYGLSGAYGLAGVLIKKGLEAHENAQVAKARAEVQQELAEVAAHNAQVAAGQADGGDAAKKAADKKKQDEKKKKKKDDGGRP